MAQRFGAGQRIKADWNTDDKGRHFQSYAEMRWYNELEQREQRGEIRKLRRDKSVIFRFEHNGHLLMTYRPDAIFEERAAYYMDGAFKGATNDDGSEAWFEVVADCKGQRTDRYKLSKKAMLIWYGISIREYDANKYRRPAKRKTGGDDGGTNNDQATTTTE